MDIAKEKIKEIADVVTEDGFELDGDTYRCGKWLHDNYQEYAEAHSIINSDSIYYVIL